LKLALICTEKLTVPPIRGGAIQILIDGVSEHLKKRHRLTIFSISDPELADAETRDGIEYVRFPRGNYVFEVARELARRSAKEQRFDLIHVFNRPANTLIYKSAMPDSRMVVSLHNEMFHEQKISTEMGKLAVRAVDRIMTVSDYIGGTIVSRLPMGKSKVQTVYSGVRLEDYRPVWTEAAQAVRRRMRERYGLGEEKVVLFVGRLSEVKGPHVLLQAMEHVAVKHRDAVLVIVGSKWFSDEGMNDYTRHLRALAERLVEDRVRFTGFVPPKQLPDHYAMGDVFVCASQWNEPLARVHYEAMAAGLPIITTRRGGNAEVIRHEINGLVIDDYANPLAFAAAIDRLLSHPAEARRMARTGREMAESRFGFEHVALRMEHLYRAAMRRRK